MHPILKTILNIFVGIASEFFGAISIFSLFISIFVPYPYIIIPLMVSAVFFALFIYVTKFEK